MSILAATATWSTRDVIAGTVVGEASNELLGGQVAIACIIRNRARHPRWWGVDLRSCALKPWQFSCWNDQLARIADNRRAASPAWRTAAGIADALLADKLDDVTLGSDHYFADYIPPPKWALLSDGRRRVPVIKIGVHQFYRLELPAPPQLLVA